MSHWILHLVSIFFLISEVKPGSLISNDETPPTNYFKGKSFNLTANSGIVKLLIKNRTTVEAYKFDFNS